MGHTMFGFFSSSPEKKLEKQIKSKRQQAMQLQRSGKLRQAAELQQEADKIEDELLRMREQAS